MESATGRIDQLKSALGDGIVAERDGRLTTSPKATEEVAAVLSCAEANQISVEIAGAGTKAGWAGKAGGDLVLQTHELSGVREHSWQDLTATVGAGTTWAEMQRVLARHGQQVALDPLWPERATVGGVIATNDSGMLRHMYGGLRDLVIGMTLVLADGTVARSGGKVVKNVAGYDLHKLMIGAFGTLAVVTEVTFRLHAVPRNARLWTLETSDVSVCEAVLMKVLDSQLSVRAMQLRTSGEGFALDIQLACVDEVMETQLQTLDALAGHAGVVGGDVFYAREQIFETSGVVIKVTMLASAIGKAVAEVRRLGGEAVVQASGIMLARLGDDSSMPDQLHEFVTAQGAGSVTVLRGGNGLGVLPSAGNAGAVMQEIKRRFDPNSTLNPGIVVGR